MIKNKYFLMYFKFKKLIFNCLFYNDIMVFSHSENLGTYAENKSNSTDF